MHEDLLIKASDSVEELLEKYPGINRLLMEMGIVCVRCGEPFWGTLETLIKNKGLDVDSVIFDLNEKLQK